MDKSCYTRCLAAVSISVFLVMCASAPALADGTLSGNAQIERVKGRPGDYVAFYEWQIFGVIDGGTADGDSFRVGDPGTCGGNPSCYFFNPMPGGNYSLFLSRPHVWGRPTVVSNVTIPGSGSASRDVAMPTDYSLINLTEWTDPWDTAWYQTFTATGTSITGVMFSLVGTNTSDILVSIHADNGGNITTWPQVGVSRIKTGFGVWPNPAGGDAWFRYLSGMIPTTPGERYALKLTGQGGNFGVYCRDEDGQGYAAGQAYNAAGVAQSFDLYGVILSDNDGTLLSYSDQDEPHAVVGSPDTRWSQQVQAMGNSLAGAFLYCTPSAGGWDHKFTFRVRSGSVNGPQVGSAKTARGAAEVGVAVVGASWNPGEVTLTPGVVYYLEVSLASGFDPYKFTGSLNAYPYGHAYKNGVAQTGLDLYMQVVEYGEEPEPPGPVEEDFEDTMPSWTSVYDAGWGSEATWTIVGGGQSGDAMRASRSSQGSSVKAKVYALEASTDYSFSVYMRSPGDTSTYWGECGYKLEYTTAQNFDADPGSWTMVQKFDNDGGTPSYPNGNGNVWTKYTKAFNSGTATYITVGYKLGSSGTGGPNVEWDTLRVTPASTCQKPVLDTAVSRKTHLGAGDWDIDVGIGDIESRSAQLGTANPSQLKILAIFDMDVAILGGTAAVTTDNGTVSAVAMFAPNTVEIDITGLGPNGTATGPLNTQVNLGFVDNPVTPTAGIVDANCPTDPAYASDSTLCVRVIVGDYDNLARTNFTDFAKVKNAGHINQLVGSVDRARADFDCSGRPNFTDFARVKNAGLINQTAPACPVPPIGP